MAAARPTGSAASWEFVILRADSTPLLYVRRPRVKGWADRHERFELRDAWGRDVGRLLQNNGYSSGLRTFALQSGGKELGRTTFTTVQVIGNDFYDYTLQFEYPPYEPVGILCRPRRVAGAASSAGSGGMMHPRT